MKFNSVYLCYPNKCSDLRYILGEPGSHNLLFVGLNPNTADEIKLDPTSRNVKRVAEDNGYDGWLLVNLCPIRCGNPANLPAKLERGLAASNLMEIKAVILKYGVRDIVLSWGDGLTIRPYLQASATKVAKLARELTLQTWCFRSNLSGQPSHPSPRIINRFYGVNETIKLLPYKYMS